MSARQLSDADGHKRPAFDLVVEAGNWPLEPVLNSWFDTSLRAASMILAEKDQSRAVMLDAGEISVVLTDDATMQRLNQEHRQQDKSTNVLSFPALDTAMLKVTDGSRPFLLGDLVFAHETVAKEAELARLSLHHHMAHLIVHGFLHLLGYDHTEDAQAEAMEVLEVRILATLSIADPYTVDTV